MMTEALEILIVDDDAGVRKALEKVAAQVGARVRGAETVAEARRRLEEKDVDLALIDLQLPDGSGIDLIQWALRERRARAAYCVTGVANCRNVVDAMKSGALDVIEKPFDVAKIRAIIEARRPVGSEELQSWRRRFAPEIVGEERALMEVLRVIRRVADTQSTVLLTGESGTGKEEAARALHNASSRRDQPFVALNCGAIPETLIESELFGHARGAFTGAVAARDGHLAAADGGTLFLDEVGDMPLAAQGKLLRVLQERKITPVGSDRGVPINVRVVAATNRPLDEMVEAGTFRADLYYRLSVIRLEIPPLRERPADVLVLARHFLRRAAAQNGAAVNDLDRDAEEALLRHPWPGNVRELANTIERAVVLRGEGTLTTADLQLPQKRQSRKFQLVPTSDPVPSANDVALNLKAALDGVERQMISQALERTGGNRSEAAALLGLNRSTLVEKIRKLAG